MTRNRATFTKIAGFKKIGKCRLCGKSIEVKDYNHYCSKCLKKIRKSEEE
ncbi:hypothetical protein GF323_02865 [Candidatus Woesearchaeota archaeon]|nr:hypothetical protein [Candidatus Woesearchaeota archaeon]